MKVSGKKFIMLLLYSPIEYEGKCNIPINGRTRLTKMGFLFEKELKSDFTKDKYVEFNLPEFTAWKYGPFSAKLINDLEFLISQEYVEVRYSNGMPLQEELEEYLYWIENLDDFESKEYNEEIFSLEENKGIKKAKDLWIDLTENQHKMLMDFKRVLVKAPLDRILEYVYKKYDKDGYIRMSLIRDKFLD